MNFVPQPASLWQLIVCLSVCLLAWTSFSLPVCLLACLPACLSLCPSFCVSACLSVCAPVCLSVCLSVCLPECLSVWVSVCLPVCHCSVCLSVCVCVCLLVCLSKCLSVCLFVRLSVCLSNPLRHIPICVTQAAVTLCLVCICLQNLFKNFYGLLSKKRHRLNQLLHLHVLNSQESQGRQVKSTYS